MLKAKFSSILITGFLLSTNSFATESDHEWISFDDDYSFAAEVYSALGNGNYYVYPMVEDETGFLKARAMNDKMASFRRLENPFMLEVKPAGVIYEDYSKHSDEISKKILLGLENLGVGNLAIISCSGYYASDNVPLCFFDYEAENSLQKQMLENGLFQMSKNHKEIPTRFIDMLIESENRARQNEVGVWTPFYDMVKGMKPGY